MQRIFYFPKLGEAQHYTVVHWNFLALSSFLENYFRWFNQACMKSVIDGFIDTFIIGARASTVGYLECYIILRRLSMQHKQIGMDEK
ncbi:hypothetical protein N7508_011115 [Penicillium antarcticum]|uniref:uncharacterized protein n=1 Tax=Penicillium antarcticum TaxID=416450 RepID=UPI00239C180A|nr:uncharacterized protein N7508_011115 [Penicillium antarcticum]KAJ5288340.1 hypothetical protein N7508_011115 [Penicillium antarcticum]